jgi:integrase
MSPITGSTTVTALSKIWLADPDLTENCTAQTVERYTDSVNQHVLPALGEYMLMEVTVSRVDRFLRNLAASTPGLAKTARSVLNGMFKLAVRHDAIRSNPVRDVRLPSKPKRPVEALTVDEVSALREGLRGWQEEAGYRGPRRGSDLLDVVDVMLGTGLRISEVLALRWDDVDLSEQPTLTVTGTLVYLKKKGLQRQSHTKTSSGFRILTLPPFVVDVLLRRRVEAIPTETNAVFPSGKGTWKWPNNYRRSLREALKTMEDGGGISPHVFRKSVATLIDAEATLEAACGCARPLRYGGHIEALCEEGDCGSGHVGDPRSIRAEPKRKRWVSVGNTTSYRFREGLFECTSLQVTASADGPPSGTRTHTESILSRLPLPIGL